jgi:hypothetical protein
MELTEKRLVSLLWILRSKEKKWSIFELVKGASGMRGEEDRRVYTKDSKGAGIKYADVALTYSPTHSFVKELEEKGFLYKDAKTGEYGVAKAADLVRIISLARPFNSLRAECYYSPLGFSDTIKMVGSSKLPYALTLFAGSELYRQHVKTEQVHAYISQGNEKEWEKCLLSKKCLKAERKDSNLVLICAESAIPKQASKVKGFCVAPAPILLSDLLSFGGLAEEQGVFLLDRWLGGELK